MTILKKYNIEGTIIKSIQSKFKTYGYRQISVPILQNYNTFSHTNSSILNNKMLKLIDNQGEILVLRPDVTIPIAKVVAKNQVAGAKQLKLFYTSNVFRILPESPKQREFTQAGVEYFGNEDIECDGEVVALAIDSLMKVTGNIQLELGNVEFYKGLLEEVKVDHEHNNLLRKLIENKNVGEIKKLVEKINMDQQLKKIFLEIPQLYGKFEDILPKAEKICINSTMKTALKDLQEIYHIIKDYGFEENVSLDFGLLNHLDYYTGIVYRGYITGHGKILLNGGRYDDLCEKFGQRTPACGFAINIDELIKGVGKVEICKREESYIDYLIVYKDGNRKDGFEIARELRALGYIVETESIKGNLRESIQCAEQKGIKEVITPVEDKIKLISIRNNTTKNAHLMEYLQELKMQVKDCVLSIH